MYAHMQSSLPDKQQDDDTEQIDPVDIDSDYVDRLRVHIVSSYSSNECNVTHTHTHTHTQTHTHTYIG